ncbi:type II secretion system protein GspL [uncultured Roseovarius sp.]|uniref:type II secretion system protein GspL n=1 Tax=uncultured Roseovarius sp. TaxID=293344 RepID=UPI00261C7F20|nr:type II secretion system protein GspL [uncultured Roseovarius sp.]
MSLALTRKSRAASTSLTLHDLSGDAPAPRVPFIACVPGMATPLVPLDLPPLLKGAGRDRVARRQLRDAYGGTEAGLDIRPARLGPEPDLWSRVLVVDAEDRRAWLARLGSASPLCQAVLPDYLTLPAALDLWVVETSERTVLARLGAEDGFAAEPDLAVALLQQAAAGAPPRAVLRTGPALAGVDDVLAALDVPTCDEPGALAAHGVSAPSRFTNGELSLDLARDPGAERAEMRHMLGRLRVPVALATLGLFGWIAATVLETRDLNAQGLVYRQNAERILRAVMIPTGPILDIRTQVSQRIDGARSASTEVETEARPLDVLRLAGVVLRTHTSTITRVNYQPGAGLVMDMQIEDFAALDALVSDLRAAGVQARVAQSVTRDDSGVEAVLAMTVNQAGDRR